MNTKILTTVVALIILVGGFFALNSFIYNEKQADFVAGETKAVTGVVLAVDLEQAKFDGPVVITLESKEGQPYTVAVPSMGLPLCAAYQSKNIAVDVYLLKPGQQLEVRGAISEDGSIVPCQSADHCLRLPLVATDFEGEADPSKMTLTMKPWTWMSAQYNDGRQIKPKKPGVFTITFGSDARFSVKTDCNAVGGTYAIASDQTLILSQIVSTKMYCEGSQEGDFIKLLENTQKYHFTSKGELIFDLKFDSGTVVFN